MGWHSVTVTIAIIIVTNINIIYGTLQTSKSLELTLTVFVSQGLMSMKWVLTSSSASGRKRVAFCFMSHVFGFNWYHEQGTLLKTLAEYSLCAATRTRGCRCDLSGCRCNKRLS
jgi:hypothetical protein